jgi:hypothetical protein
MPPRSNEHLLSSRVDQWNTPWVRGSVIASVLGIALLIVSPGLSQPSLTGSVPVASGLWRDVTWVLDACATSTLGVCQSPALGGRLSTEMTENGMPEGGAGEGNLPPRRTLEIGWFGGRSVPQPYLHGTVIPSADEVDIKLTTGKTLRATTILLPSGFWSNTRLFVAPMPCGAVPTSAVALAASGQIVATWSLPLHVGPYVPC